MPASPAPKPDYGTVIYFRSNVQIGQNSNLLAHRRVSSLRPVRVPPSSHGEKSRRSARFSRCFVRGHNNDPAAHAQTTLKCRRASFHLLSLSRTMAHASAVPPRIAIYRWRHLPVFKVADAYVNSGYQFNPRTVPGARRARWSRRAGVYGQPRRHPDPANRR